MKRGLFFTMAVGCLLAASPLAQQPPPQPQDPPSQGAKSQQPPVTFKVEINYVEVDAIVTDERGNLVRGLTRNDFEVFEDGKPQQIELFSEVEVPFERPASFSFTSAPVVPDVRSNAKPFDGRLWVFVLDEQHTAALRSTLVKRAAKTFIEKYMGANDLAAVVTTGGRADAGQEFTNNKALLLAAVDKFMGQKLRSRTLERLDEYQRQRSVPTGSSDSSQSQAIKDPLDMERGYKARTSLSTLRNLADFMTGIRGRRKAVLFFSEGIDYPIYDVFNSRDASTILQETRDAITAAARANVNFFTIDPRGLHTMGDEIMDMGAPAEDPALGLNPQGLDEERRLSADSLRTLAEETGGFAAVETNDFAGAFQRILGENSSYYVLGYYPPSDKRDGRFHRIEVKTKRPGLKVTARKGYASPKGKQEKQEPPATAGTSPALRELMGSPLPASGLTLSVHGAAFTGAKENVSVTVEIQGSNLKFEEKGGLYLNTIELSVLPLESRGKPLQGTRSEVKLSLKPQTYELTRRTSIRMSPRLSLPPGKYQIRVAARESGGGTTGSVFYDLEVPDFTKPKLAMSGVVLTAASATVTPTAQADPLLKQALPGPPTARREFFSGDAIGLYTEVYDNVPSDTPHKVDITLTVRGEDGREVARNTDERSSSELQGAKSGGFGYTAQFPLKDLRPGRYLLRVEARSRLKDIDPVGRDVPFTVLPQPAPRPGGGGG
jgi:VWFA-related protein